MNLNPIQYFKNMNTRISRTSFTFILIAIAVYFLVNGKAFFSNWDETYGQLIMIYLLMMVVFLVWSGRETEEDINRPVHESMAGFVGFFIGTYFLLSAISYVSGSSVNPIPKELFWPTVIVQVCIVATPEELMFRGIMLEKFGIIVSSILFSIWHVYAYNIIFHSPETIGIATIGSAVVAFVMGIILALVKRKFGISSAIAIHACYNLFVSGAFVTFSMI